MRVAVVGGGVSGAFCAYALRASDYAVTMFDMGRSGPGGRATTRRQDGYVFDHGCSFIAPVQDARVSGILEQLGDRGVVREWDTQTATLDWAAKHLQASTGTGGQHGFCNHQRSGKLLCGVPGMGAVISALTENTAPSQPAPRWHTTVRNFEWQKRNRQWELAGVSGSPKDAAAQAPAMQQLGTFDAVVIADQTMFHADAAGRARWQVGGLESIFDKLHGVRHDPAFSLMVAFNEPLKLPHAAYELTNHPVLRFLSCDSSKPGRRREDGSECWVAITTASFAEQVLADFPPRINAWGNPHAADYREVIRGQLETALYDVLSELDAQFGLLDFSMTHRWRRGFVSKPIGQAELHDADKRVVFCGDGCLGSTFENAAISGLEAAKTVQGFAI